MPSGGCQVVKQIFFQIVRATIKSRKKRDLIVVK
jgi:hypothetical protein